MNTSVEMPSIPKQMIAVVLEGHGGPSKLVIKDDVAVPTPQPGEALVRVEACGVNNTDVNTRLGWYDSSVRGGTSASDEGYESVKDDSSGTWGGSSMAFPRIQGADVVGYVVAVGDDNDEEWIGRRVMADPVLRQGIDEGGYDGVGYLGSERDGGFAQFVSLPLENLEHVQCDWKDKELATLPCSYSAAENLVDHAGVCEKDVVLVTGASGGVGSALVQLSKRRGAKVVALTSESKAEKILAIGADGVIRRDIDDWESVIKKVSGKDKVTVVTDVVGAPAFDKVTEVLARGGRYVISGAIGGKVVEMDLSLLYLKDWKFIGCTVTRPHIFKNLVKYAERGEIRPLLAGCYPLDKIHEIQEMFGQKKHIGSFVLIPPKVDS